MKLTLVSFFKKCGYFLLFVSLHSHGVELINLAQQAINLSKLSNTLSDKEKILYWNQHIERVSPSFFNSIYYDKKNDFVLATFKFYQSLNESEIRNAYTLYEEKVTQAFNKYELTVADYNDDIQVFLAPGIGWGGSYIHSNGQDFLALGVDLHLKAPERIAGKLTVLINHEIYHHYHAQLRNSHIEYQRYLTEGKLFWQLWDEGMATWGSGFVTNNQNYHYAMLQDYQDYIPCKNDAKLAQKFLEEINNPAIDLEQPMNVKKWFGSRSPSSLGEDIPGAFGYYLGWKVINQISQTIPKETFMAWNYQQAKPYIEEQLKIIAKAQECQ